LGGPFFGLKAQKPGRGFGAPNLQIPRKKTLIRGAFGDGGGPIQFPGV